MGDLSSPVFANFGSYTHINVKNLFAYGTLYKIRQVLEKTHPDEMMVISSGGLESWIMLSLASRNKYLITHMKAGGGPPKYVSLFRNIPMIVFDKNDYKRLRKDDNRRTLSVITGRVRPIVRDNEYIKRLTTLLLGSSSHKIPIENLILTVSRINTNKKIPLYIISKKVQHLKETYNKNEFRHVFLGHTSDESLASQLQKVSNSDLINDKRTCEEASKSLYLAEVFVGIGRSALEAISIGIPTFVPVANGSEADLIQVTPENWAVFAESNFTHRADYNKLKCKFSLSDYFGDKNWSIGKSIQMQNVFNKELSAQSSVDKFRNHYEEIKYLNVTKGLIYELFRLSKFVGNKCLMKLKRYLSRN